MDLEYHTRWDEDHRQVCQDCYEDWLDACYEMENDARLDNVND